LCNQFISHIPTLITEEDKLELNKIVLEEEIFDAIKQFNPDKASGLNGFTIQFYIKCWSIIKFDFIWMIGYVHMSSYMGGATNSSFLALIPKEKNPTSFERFRPIYLCNVSYKIMANSIANRLNLLLSHLIIPNQRVFVAK
jgi:hypothetical protein